MSAGDKMMSMNRPCKRLLFMEFVVRLHRGCMRLPSSDPSMQQPWTLEQPRSSCRAVQPDFASRRAQIEAARGTAQSSRHITQPRFDTNNPQVFNGRNTLPKCRRGDGNPRHGEKASISRRHEVARQTEHNYFQDRYALLTAIRQQFYQLLGDQRRIAVLTELLDIVRKASETGMKR